MSSQTYFTRPSNMIPLMPSGTLGLMVPPACPHEGCGWFMPQLWCPDHGNFGMTFLSARSGVLTHVRAVLDVPREPLAADSEVTP